MTIDGDAKSATANSAAPGEAVSVPAPAAKPKAALKKKPIAVASTPVIGNYKLPPVDLLNAPDLTVKPTESKEELMANARLMQQTLAQFDIEVSLGDITKGPTITRYELHPAPGVKLEKIAGLNNNIAAALKAERIHILAPVPGKSSVGIEVPNVVKTKVILRDLLESDPDSMVIVDGDGRIAESTYDRERCHSRAQTYGIGSFQKALLEIVNEEDRERRTLRRRMAIFTRDGENGAYRRSDEEHVLRIFLPSEVRSLLEGTGFTAKQRRRYGKLPVGRGRAAFVAAKPR